MIVSMILPSCMMMRTALATPTIMAPNTMSLQPLMNSLAILSALQR